MPTSLLVAAGDRLDFTWKYAAIDIAVNYSVLGVYGTNGVVVAVDSAIAGALLGRSWQSIFSNPGFTEARVHATLGSFANQATDDDDYAGVVALGGYLSGLQVDINGAPRLLCRSDGF